MRHRRLVTLTAALGMSVALVAGCSSGDSDKKSSKSSSDTGVTAPAQTGTPVAVTVGDVDGVSGPAMSMTMTVAPASVAAGSVTFTLKNEGTIEHEVVVLKTDTPYDQLVVTDGKVSEDTSQGEVPELAAGKSESVTLDLTAGNYVLVCNIKDHYTMGMRAPFTVT
jgi:uncharacterized cupredoxin-like copper-binding protein